LADEGEWCLITSGAEAFRWSQGGGFEGLEWFPGGQAASYGNAISNDGQAVAGYAEDINHERIAMRWTPQAGMVPLGFVEPPGDFSIAYGISGESAYS
jgi:probable HAF family extracellular repeat protein